MPYLSWHARLDDLRQLRNYASGLLRQELDQVIERLQSLPANCQARCEIIPEPLPHVRTISRRNPRV